MLYGAGSTMVAKDKHISFTLTAGTYSINVFNKKSSTLHQRKAPQIKDLKLLIPQRYSFMASNRLFIALGILDSSVLNKYLEKTTFSKTNLPPGAYKTSPDTSPALTLLSLHCRKINRVTNELDEKPSILLACKQVLYKAVFTQMYLVFLELDTHYCHLGFKLLVENVIIQGQRIKTMSM